MKHKRNVYHTGGKTVHGLPFMGEVMTCAMCGKQHKSDPKVQSGWTRLEDGHRSIYICPAELPGENGTAEEFERAWAKILLKLAGG